ncbi:MAG TPA: BTAD domain-containing putative transcriptional regulator [Vicinamibacteria bacterium]|nr:BTAD domain-containing putative transcriptional regulator [Vicinamibacteria bacterium]
MAIPDLPFAARAHVTLARVLDWLWPSAAAAAYADALSHAPRSAELHLLRGQALGRAGRWPEAVRCLALAAQLQPTSLDYQGALVLALGRTGRDQALLAALKRLAHLRPGEGEIHVLVGTLQRRCGRPAEALRSFRLAVRLAATPSTRRFLLGEELLGREGWEGALAACGWARALAERRPATAEGRSALNYHPGREVVPAPRLPAPGRRWPDPLRRLRAIPLFVRWAFQAAAFRGAARLDREQRIRALRRACRRTQKAPSHRRAA